MTSSTSPLREASTERPRHSLIDRAARRLVMSQLSSLRHGAIELHDRFGRTHWGESRTPAARLHVWDDRFYRSAVLGGSVGVAESYMRGEWKTDDLTALLKVFANNIESADALDSTSKPWRRPLSAALNWARRNNRTGSRRNIHQHYDLGNEFFASFLDSSMTYSCGYFETPDSTLLEASKAKLDRACRHLRLKPEDRVLEIGTGWGSFAIHAASRYKCRVSTVTISKEQHEYARMRVEKEGLSDRINVILSDYRDIKGSYDKLVSIEMIEAVGHEYLSDFFSACSRLLNPDGAMFLQAITMPDHRYESYRRGVDFIRRYIFPGCCVPSLAAMSDALARGSDLRIVSVDDIGPHYAHTLRLWRERFLENSAAIRSLGFPKSFLRMWEYYFAYCEAGFAERYLGDLQLLLVKPRSQIIPPHVPAIIGSASPEYIP